MVNGSRGVGQVNVSRCHSPFSRGTGLPLSLTPWHLCVCVCRSTDFHFYSHVSPNAETVTVAQLVRSTWRKNGIRGFYRGITASYVGSLETAVNFALYENIKGQLLQWGRTHREDEVGDCQQLRGTQGGSKLAGASDTALCMGASAFSKVVAITALYPHGRRFVCYRIAQTIRTLFVADERMCRRNL